MSWAARSGERVSEDFAFPSPSLSHKGRGIGEMSGRTGGTICKHLINQMREIQIAAFRPSKQLITLRLQRIKNPQTSWGGKDRMEISNPSPQKIRY
jgi:hypothetical protein